MSLARYVSVVLLTSAFTSMFDLNLARWDLIDQVGTFQVGCLSFFSNSPSVNIRDNSNKHRR